MKMIIVEATEDQTEAAHGVMATLMAEDLNDPAVDLDDEPAVIKKLVEGRYSNLIIAAIKPRALVLAREIRAAGIMPARNANERTGAQ